MKRRRRRERMLLQAAQALMWHEDVEPESMSPDCPTLEKKRTRERER